MKRIIFPTLIIIVTIVVTACAKEASQSNEDMINPEDKIGDFLITTGDNENITFLADIHCPVEQSTGIKSCELPVGTKFNISPGIYDDNLNSGKSLDEYWSESTLEILIEGRPVNLQPFGIIEITHSLLGKMRLWNVVIVNDKPGKITIKNLITSGDESFEFPLTVTFVKP